MEQPQQEPQQEPQHEPPRIEVNGRSIERRAADDADFQALFDEVVRLRTAAATAAVVSTAATAATAAPKVCFKTWYDPRALQQGAAAHTERVAAAVEASASTLAADAIAPPTLPTRPHRSVVFPHSLRYFGGKTQLVVESLARFDVMFKVDESNANTAFEIDVVFAGTNVRPRIDAQDSNAHFKIHTRRTDEPNRLGGVQTCLFDSDVANGRTVVADSGGLLVFRSLFFMEDVMTSNLKKPQDFELRISPVAVAGAAAAPAQASPCCSTPPFRVLFRHARGIKRGRAVETAKAAALAERVGTAPMPVTAVGSVFPAFGGV